MCLLAIIFCEIPSSSSPSQFFLLAYPGVCNVMCSAACGSAAVCASSQQVCQSSQQLSRECHIALQRLQWLAAVGYCMCSWQQLV
jgi:hypothetical protein